MMTYSETYQPYGERYDQELSYRQVQKPGDAVYVLQRANELAGSLPVGAETDSPQAIRDALKIMEKWLEFVRPTDPRGWTESSTVFLSKDIKSENGSRSTADGTIVLGPDSLTQSLLINPDFFAELQKAVPIATGGDTIVTFRDIAFPDKEIVAFKLSDFQRQLNESIQKGRSRAGRGKNFLYLLGGLVAAGGVVALAITHSGRGSRRRGLGTARVRARGERVCIRRPASRPVRLLAGFAGGALAGGAAEFARRTWRRTEQRPDADPIGYALSAGIGGLIGGVAMALPAPEIPC